MSRSWPVVDADHLRLRHQGHPAARPRRGKSKLPCPLPGMRRGAFPTPLFSPRPDMPQSAIMPVAVYSPPTNKIYVFGGEDGDTGTNYNITRIYDIAGNSWTTGANMPDVRSFAAGGYVPATGMIYIVAGYNTGDVTSSQNTTWQYDPASDTWTDLTATDPYPHAAGGFAYGVINDKLYVHAGRSAAVNIIK